MTTQELIRLYTEGQLPRRDFVRRLSVAGVSAGAAIAYAQTLAPSASAAVGRLDLQQQGEYGGAIGEAIQALLAALAGIFQAIIDFLDAILALFTPDDFSGFAAGGLGVFDELQTLLAQLGTQNSAIANSASAQLAITLQPLKVRSQAAMSLLQADTADEAVAKLGDALDLLVRAIAGTIPAAGDSALSQTLSSIATVNGSQAAFVRILRGTSAFPSALETPVSAIDARDQIDAILA